VSGGGGTDGPGWCASRSRPFAGTVVGSDYDPNAGEGGRACAARAGAALLTPSIGRLADTAVLGVVTNMEFAPRFLLADPDVIAGRLDTGWLDRRAGDFVSAASPSDEQFSVLRPFHWLLRLFPAPAPLVGGASGWRVGPERR